MPTGARPADIAQDQVIQGAAEQVADGQDLVHLRVGLVGLPLGHCLTGYPYQHGQPLLGHVALRPQVLQVGSETHDVFLPIDGTPIHPATEP